MGSCISKCNKVRRRKKMFDDSSHVQDKLVIALDRVKIPKMPLEKPLSPTPSSSFSYSKCTIPTSSSSSSSSSTSSTFSACSSSVKDRTFTNEFLQSCVKENPRAIRLNPAINKMSAAATVTASVNKIHPPSPDLSTLLVNRSFQQTTLKKRARSRSPSTLVRQKSFRRDQNAAAYNSIPNRGGVRSPSPSRRFNADNARSFPVYESPRRGPIVNSGGNYAMKREIFRSPVRDNNLKKINSRVDHDFCQRVSRNIDEKSRQEVDVAMEDIDNPHIALDCFIFL